VPFSVPMRHPLAALLVALLCVLEMFLPGVAAATHWRQPEAIAALRRRPPRWVPRGLPVAGRTRITSGFGMRRDPIVRRRFFHNGIDLAARRGTPVRTMAPGRVAAAGWAGAYGRRVVVDHGQGWRTLYGHLSRIDVRRGQRLARGARVGRVGSSGRSTGPHLHYMVLRRGKPLNPRPYLRRR